MLCVVMLCAAGLRCGFLYWLFCVWVAGWCSVASRFGLLGVWLCCGTVLIVLLLLNYLYVDVFVSCGLLL